MNLKTNVTRRDFHFSVAAEGKDGSIRFFAYTVEAESDEAARLQLLSYLDSRGLKPVATRLNDD